MEPSNRYGLAGLLTAKIVCCGALVLSATGAISFAGLVSWLAGSGLFWLAAVLAIIGVYLVRRSVRMNDNNVRNGPASHRLHSRPE